MFGWKSAKAGKHKFHLALSWDYDFVFLNSPRTEGRRNPHEFTLECSLMSFLMSTSTGLSIVGCNDIQRMETQKQFNSQGPSFKGSLATRPLLRILDHICR